MKSDNPEKTTDITHFFFDTDLTSAPYHWKESNLHLKWW